MKLYELTYLLLPQLSEKDRNAIQEKLRTLIESEGGILDTSTQPGVKRLAYPIKKQSSAWLGTIHFYLDQSKLPEVPRGIKKEDAVLRFLLVARELVKKAKPLPRRPISRIKPVKPTKKPKVEIEKLEEKLEEILGD